MKNLSVKLAIFPLLALVFLTACQKAYHQEDERYILVTANVGLPYWQEASSGLLDSARLLGVKAEVVGPSTYDPEAQLQAFQQAVASRPAGILVSPTSADLFAPAIDAAIQQGIPVICVDSDAPQSKRLMFIGTENFRAGMASGRQLAEILGGQGRVLVISIPGQLNLDERLRGLREVFRQHSGLQVARIVNDEGDPVKAYEQVEKVLTAGEKIDLIVALEASGGRGAAEMLQRVGLAGKIPIVAMDKNPSTLEWIERGVISATIAQKPYTMSFYGLRFLDDLHHNVVREFKNWQGAPVSPLPDQVDTGTAVVNASNVAAFRRALGVQPKEAP